MLNRLKANKTPRWNDASSRSNWRSDVALLVPLVRVVIGGFLKIVSTFAVICSFEKIVDRIGSLPPKIAERISMGEAEAGL
jgi:hypothetical protein